MKWLFLVFSLPLMGQNFVKNGYFEDCDCPKETSHVPLGKCKDIASLETTPDYFNSCNSFIYNTSWNYMGGQDAFSGNGMMGMFLSDGSSPHQSKYLVSYRSEYLVLKLRPDLKSGNYVLSFYMSQAECSELLIDEMGFLFVNDLKEIKFRSGRITNFTGKISLDNVNGVYEKWVSVKSEVRLTGREKFLIIGAFNNQVFKTKSVLPDTLNWPCSKVSIDYAYYVFDNIELFKTDSITTEYTHH